MGVIKLDGSFELTDTLIPNRFLDYYMPSANGEFVKIYLYLLRALSCPDSNISICHIADIFNHTEKDVLRALKYWEKVNLIDLCFDSDKSLTGITLKPVSADYITDNQTLIEVQKADIVNPSKTTKTAYKKAQSNVSDKSSADKTVDSYDTSPATNVRNSSTIKLVGSSNNKDTKKEAANFGKREKHTYTANEISSFRSKSEVTEFLYLAEKYIGKTLSGADINSLLYIYDVLEFEPELIEYLVEYCVTNGHKSLRYIEKVALSWSDDGINSVELARAHTDLFSKNCYPVLKAFGLSGRNPGEGEKAMVVKWTNSYGFDMDIILDACNRTINTIHQPSFEYADSILSKWKEKGIKSLSDVKALDAEYIKNKADSVTKTSSGKSITKTDKNSKSKNSFNNFSQRDYDYETLEKKLLSN